MASQSIILGDCLDVLANERNVPAIVADPPGNINFMGRSWDRAHPCNDYVLPCVPRSKAHERELRSEESFVRYWATRYAMAYDIADQHATAIIWTLPRTSYQTATAMRRAGWDIRDNLVHLFGTGWAKTGNALAPGQEGWILATKGKPDLSIDACRVPRGAGESTARPSGVNGHVFGTDNRRNIRGGNGEGSLPKNALLSHCEECVRVGMREVSTGKLTDDSKRTRNANRGNCYGDMPSGEHPGFSGKTESVPAWHCLAGCVCGARSKWDPEKPLPRCPCGEAWRWICPVAEVNGQSGESKSTTHHRGSGVGYGGGNADRGIVGPTDQGGSSRFFNCFSWLRFEESCYADVCQKQTHGDITAKANIDGIESGASPEAGSCCNKSRVDGCGKWQTDQSQRATRSIIETTTDATIGSKISNAFEPTSTTSYTDASEKTTPSSTGSSIGDASDAMNTDGSTSSSCVAREHTRGIACHAQPHTFANGEAKTRNTSSSIILPTTPNDAQRFKYLSKCSSSERHAGCENLFWRANKKNPFGFDQVTREEWEAIPADQRAQGNVHPTVKGYRLMHWIHSLTGASKIVDLCGGSGSGMITAAIDGIEWIGAEICPEAVTIAQARHVFWSSLSPEAIEVMRNDSATKAIQKQNKLSKKMEQQ